MRIAEPLVWSLIPVGIWVVAAAWGIWDAYRYPAHQWAEAGRSRPAWVAVMVIGGIFGVLLYAGTARYHVRDPGRYRVVDGVAPADR